MCFAKYLLCTICNLSAALPEAAAVSVQDTHGAHYA